MALKPPIRHPHVHARMGTAPADGRFTTALPAGCLGMGVIGRARKIPLDDWHKLGRSERSMVSDSLTLFAIGKGVLAESLTILTVRRCHEMPDHVADLLADSAKRQHRHYKIFRTLQERLAPPSEPPDSEFEPSLLRDMINDILPSELIQEAEDSPHGVTIPAILMEVILLDVVAETGFRGMRELLTRNQAMEEVRELLWDLRTDDKAGLRKSRELLSACRYSNPEVTELIDTAIDRAVLPSVEVVRNFQRRFDFVSLGLVPDEFVACTLNRLFELTE